MITHHPGYRSVPQLIVMLALLLLGSLATKGTPAAAVEHFNGARTLETTGQIVAIGPRWPGSEGHRKVEAFLKKTFAKDSLEDDAFTANTPAGPMQMHNFIVRFPGKKDGVILLGSHYDTNYPLRDTSFVGANDGAATSALLIELASHLRGPKLEGYSVWLVFFDGEEAIQSLQSWSRSDSTYGSRHLAAKWQNDGTLKRVKALLMADMIGDKDLDIVRDSNSTGWLVDIVKQAATKYGYQSHFFQTESTIDDDHIPFVQRGVPSVDVIDLDYGPNNEYHHTVQDTMDKLSAKSLTIAGDTFLESIRLINLR
jgi:glutaminyl-peptide cyclotransferase